MIVPEHVYNEIVKKFQNHKGSYRDLKNLLIEEYNIPNSVISSLLSNEYKRRIKKNIYKMNSQGNKIFQRYIKSRIPGKDSSAIIKMAEEMKMSPTLVARLIIEKFFNKSVKIKNHMKDTTLIEDQDLAYETFLCVVYDEQYGPLTETICQLIGKEYEYHLQNIVTGKNLTFQSEEDLRVRGYDKTPDIKLNIPFAVDGFVVNWIESKALFASPKVHKGYIEEQYSSYWNRFGTGLVIYWKGLVDSVIDPKEKRFIVRCTFPENITVINPFSIAIIPAAFKSNVKVLEKTEATYEME